MMEKKICTACSACVNICPKSCITFIEDNEGFLYPQKDVSRCVDCGLCDKICPLLSNQHSYRQPCYIFACRAISQKILTSSSSGGMFSLIATEFINYGGTVTAVHFDDNNNVIYGTIGKIDELESYKRSKYVQSNLGKIFKDIKDRLRNNENVLFVGTPCQVAGLLSFLRKPYDNLFCIDFVCHGVPSPGVWKEYLKTLGTGISNINFRDKETGWPNYSFSYIKDGIKYKQCASENPYMRGFLHDLYLRPSCYECKFKGFSSGADLTLSDFWGVWKNFPKWNDQKGAGVIAVNTIKGKSFFDSLDKNLYEKVELTVQQAYIDYNSSAYHCAKPNPKREIFFSRFRKEPLVPLIYELSKDSALIRIKNILSKVKHKLL